MAIMIGAGTAKEAWGERSGIRKPKTELPRKTDGVDYEKYVVRKPAHGHGACGLIVMDKDLVREADHHIELGWMRRTADGDVHGAEAVHDRNEIIFHIGGDVNNPLDLGGEVVFVMGGQSLASAKTCGLWVPKGVEHGPFTLKRLEKPYIQMTFVIGRM